MVLNVTLLQTESHDLQLCRCTDHQTARRTLLCRADAEQRCTGTPASQDLTGSVNYSPRLGSGPLSLVGQIGTNYQTRIVPIG